MHHALDLAPVADQTAIARQLVDLVRRQVRHRLRVEAVERLARPRPLGVDHLPGHTGLEDSLAHHVEVIDQPSRVDLLRRFHPPLLCRADGRARRMVAPRYAAATEVGVALMSAPASGPVGGGRNDAPLTRETFALTDALQTRYYSC